MALDSNLFCSHGLTFAILVSTDSSGVSPLQLLQLFLCNEDGFHVFNGAHGKLQKCIGDSKRVKLLVEASKAF